MVRMNLKEIALIIFFLLVAIGLRLLLITQDQLWMDEAYSVIISRRELARIIQEIPGIGSPPFYNFLLHFWIKLFGESELTLRILSAFFGICFIILIYNIGKSWFNKSIGLIACGIASVNAIHIFYSQQARTYSLLIFLSLLSAHFLYLCLIKYRKSAWIGYIATTSLLLYSHNWSLFLLPVPYVYLILSNSYKNNFKPLILAQLSILLIYSPFLPCLFEQSFSGSSAWISYFWEKLNPLFALLKSFEIFFMGGEFLTFGEIPFGRIVPGLLLLFILIYAFSPSHPKEKNKESKNTFLFLLCYTLIPLLIPYLFSIYRPLYIPGRYDTIVFGGFFLLLAIGFFKMPKRIFAFALSAFILLSLLNLYGFYFKRTPRHENKNMALFLKENARPNDLILFTGLTRLPIEYYLGNDFNQFKIKHYPNDVEKNIGYFDYQKYLKNRNIIEKEIFDFVSKNQQEKRIWVCSNRWMNFVFEKEADFLNEPLYFALSTQYPSITVHPFRKAFILEFKKSP